MSDREPAPDQGWQAPEQTSDPTLAPAFTPDVPDDPEAAARERAHNKTVLRRFLVNVLGNGQLDLIDDIFHEEMVIKTRPNMEELSERAAMKEYYSNIRARFRDLDIEVEDVVASRTEAIAKVRATAVHQKDYFGVDASDREVSFPFMSRAVFEDGKMIEQGDIVNPLRMQPPIKRHARSTLTDQIREGLVVVDGGGLVAEVNAAAERLLGVEEGAVLNDPVESLFEDEVTLPAVGESTEIAVDDGQRILDLAATSLMGPDDDRMGRILTLRDVTDRVRRRQQLETLTRQNERLDRFVGVVSHDLRSPLKKASGFLDLARETGEDRHFRKVEDAHDRVATMVEELLTMARSGMTVDDTEPVILAHVVEDAWATVETDGATLETELPTGGSVEADRNLLRHVFENLFRNAVEHGSGGSRRSDDGADRGGSPVTVTVGALPDDDGGFFVADDGPGIPPDEREAVFEHGYTTDGGGTGFGLSIVQQFVEAHGWGIAVGEGESGGARFEVATGGTLEPA